jgi:beta-galactosidase
MRTVNRLFAVLAAISIAPSVQAQQMQNLALRAVSATASSWRPEFPPKGVIDGDPNTSFSVALGASRDQWFKLQWASPEKIGGLVFTQPDRYTRSMNVEALQDGKWVRVAHVGAPGEELGVNFCITFEPVTTTEIRLANIDSTPVGGAAYYEVEVYSDPKTAVRAANRVDVAAAGDATGRMVGTVSTNNGRTGLVGVSVIVSGTSPLGPWRRKAVTQANGLWVTNLPLNLTGTITVEATQGAHNGQLLVEAMDIAQQLTPWPAQEHVSLAGTWDFLPDPPVGFQNKAAGLAWKPLKVPSNYEMEGFTTKTDIAAYHRMVTIPNEWTGKRIRLRAQAIYSSCSVWLNGRRVGGHDGGATPFELDLTDAAKHGQPNDLCILVNARSKAAAIDNMSVYAYFEIAGIWRPIELFCLEPVHVARLTYATVFDKQYQDADLTLNAKVVNEHAKAVSATLALTVLDPDGRIVKLDGLDASVSLGPWDAKTVTLKTRVKQPIPWNAELPRMYTIVAKLDSAGQNSVKIEQPLGFRQVEIKGRAFTINGKPVRLFGACLHAADPLMGRAITVERVRQDLELMKGANLNAIRTSHYPPHPMTPVIADTLGLYIEDEGPSCWGNGNEDLRNAPLYIGIVSQYVERDRNHPSVVYWSTCNESNYGVIFQLAHRYVKQLDPTRPVGGSYAPLKMDNDLFVIHHPTNIHEDIQRTKSLPKPVFYDECLSVYHGWGDLAYSLEIDPGMHDYWGTGVLGIRRQTMACENQVGTMHWAWVDDAFAIPGRGIDCWRRDAPAIRYSEPVYKMPGRGYQGDTVWGVVDGWRRPRPEWWLMKKIYTPVLIEAKPLPLPAAGKPISVPVENMNWFANLNAYQCRWEIGGHKGTARADVAASSKGVLNIPAPAGVTGDEMLTLEWFDETGRMVDAYKLRFKEYEKPAWRMGKAASIVEEDGRYLSGARAVYLKGNHCEIALDKVSGGLMWALKDSEQVLSSGPTLHVLNGERPTADDPQGWRFAHETHQAGLIRWNGAFGSEYEGGYSIRMDEAGQIEVAYEFKYKGAAIYAREVGLQWELPLAFDRLAWDRAAEHSVYPADHIGRPAGMALAHSSVPQTVPPGGRPFALDDHPWGSNDFRSAKRGIYWASLTNKLGQGVKVLSDGTQIVRCTLGVHGVRFSVLDFYGGSGGKNEWSVLGFHYGPGKLIKTGDILKGTVRLQLLGGNK